MEDPEVISKYLGCNHHISSKMVGGGHVVTTAKLDMADYMRQACEVYVTKTGQTLKTVDSPYAPDLPQAQLDDLLAKPGKFQHLSASVLMKLLYAARIAVPWLSVSIQRLAGRSTSGRLRRTVGYTGCMATCIRPSTRS